MRQFSNVLRLVSFDDRSAHAGDFLLDSNQLVYNSEPHGCLTRVEQAPRCATVSHFQNGECTKHALTKGNL